MKTKIYIVAINNLSLNSFSECGNSVVDALTLAKKQIDLGADYIDFGAQSTAPGAPQIDEADEKSIINKVLENYSGVERVSIDTTRSSVAEIAVKKGVAIINDISGFRFDTNMLKIIAENKNIRYVLTHSCGQFDTLHSKYYYPNIIEDISSYLKKEKDRLHTAGIDDDRIIVDFGFGFSKTGEQNLEIIQNIDKSPTYKKVLVGISRKKFIKNISVSGVKEELDSITSILHLHIVQKLIEKGTEEIYIRTHNVEQAFLLRKVILTLNLK